MVGAQGHIVHLHTDLPGAVAWGMHHAEHPVYHVTFHHRVLHGRSTFTGERRLCGAYVNRDDWMSRLRLLERRFGATAGIAGDDGTFLATSD